MPNETPVKHHEFSPSRLEKFSICPWSYKNCLGWISESGQDAQRGTLMHRAVYDDEALTQLNTRDQDVIRGIRQEHTEKPEFKGLEKSHELYVEIKDDDGSLLTAGILDFLVISKNGKLASVYDWKFGNHPVSPASDNDQIIPYVVGVFQKFPNVQEVYAMIVQPIFDVDYERQAIFKREQLPELLSRIRDNRRRAENATEEDAVISPFCKYCNRYNCRKYRQQMEDNVKVLALGENTEILTHPYIDMTVEYADRLLTAKKEIESIMDEKTADAKKVVIDAGGSENFKIIAGRTTRRTDWKKLAADKGITDDEIAGYTTESVGEPYLAPRLRQSKKKTDKFLSGK